MRRSVAPVVLALVAGACTNGPAPRVTTTTTIAIELETVPPITDLGPADPVAAVAADAGLIDVADVPGGWELRPTADHRARIDPTDCAANAVTLAAATGDDLVLPDGTVVAQSVVAGDGVVVDDAFAQFDVACVARVSRRVVETLIAALPGTPRGVTIGEPEVTVAQLAAADASAFTAAFPIRVDSVDGVMFVQVIAARRSGVLVVLTARRPATALGEADLVSLVDIAARRAG